MDPCGADTLSELDRPTAEKLRDLKEAVEKIGKKSVQHVFALGAAFEEAASILRGRYDVWLEHEIRIDPRTVRGYRRAHRVLGPHREMLAEAKVAPTVVVRLASATGAVRTRALELIASGRSVRLADLKSLATGKAAARPARRDWIEEEAVSGSRRLADAVVSLKDRIATCLASSDAEGLAAAATDAATLAEAASMLLSVDGGDPDARGPRFAAALATFAATEPGALETAARAVVAAANGESETPVATPLPAVARRANLGCHVPPSVFRHGLTVLELCAGAGGQALGLAGAGFDHVAMVEIEPIACKTLREAFRGATIVEADLRNFDPSPYGRIDLLAGGVPCTPFTKDGERKGKDDDRDLFPVALDLVEAIRPRAVMLENVDSILDITHDDYRLFILERLGAAGYRCEWRKVKATDFGVPQARVRAILVGFREPEAMARFSWPTSFAGYGDTPRTAGAALAGQLEAHDWVPPESLLETLDKPSPTVVGGSKKKKGTGLGRKNAKGKWLALGVDDRTIGGGPPDEDHAGPFRLTLPMIAALQGFPGNWPFQGNNEDRFRQIGNAFPPAVALHLGCAVASALEGVPYDAGRQVWFETLRWTLLGGRSRRTRAETAGALPAPTGPGMPRESRPIPLAVLNAASSIGEPEEPTPWEAHFLQPTMQREPGQTFKLLPTDLRRSSVPDP